MLRETGDAPGEGKRIRIAHLIVGLGLGGAEAVLHRLVRYSDPSRFEHQVISLSDEGVYGEMLRTAGATVESLGMSRSPLSMPRGILRAAELVASADIVECWMPHASLVGWFAALLKHRPNVLHVVHMSNTDPRQNSLAMTVMLRILARMVRSARAVIYVANAARDSHVALGYPKERSLIIPNGVETDRFHPDPSASAWLRGELGVSDRERLVLVVSRWGNQKDIPNFVRAFGEICRHRTDVVAVMCGAGLTPANADLMELVRQQGVESRLHLLGPRGDVERIMAGAELLVLPSSGEACPNVIPEALACELPCVVTDVGDCRLMLGEAGWVVPPEDSATLAAEVGRVLSLDPTELRRYGVLGRKRVLEQYGYMGMVAAYEQLYVQLHAEAAKGASAAERG